MDLTKHTPGHVSVSVKMKRAVWNVTAALLFRPFPPFPYQNISSVAYLSA